MFLFSSNSEWFLGCGLMILHCRWHVWISTMAITTGFKLSITCICWHSCRWSDSGIYTEILNKIFTSGISVSYGLKRSLTILSDCISKTNGWNCVNIKELEIIGISIAMEHICWLLVLVSNKLHSSKVLKSTGLSSIYCTLNSMTFCTSLKINCLSNIRYRNSSSHSLIHLTI